MLSSCIPNRTVTLTTRRTTSDMLFLAQTFVSLEERKYTKTGSNEERKAGEKGKTRKQRTQKLWQWLMSNQIIIIKRKFIATLHTSKVRTRKLKRVKSQNYRKMISQFACFCFQETLRRPSAVSWRIGMMLFET